MSEDQFMKLFRYIEEFRSEMNEKLDSKANQQDVDQILRILDEMNQKQDISDDERLVMGHQLERLDKWVHALAKEIGYKLPA